MEQPRSRPKQRTAGASAGAGAGAGASLPPQARRGAGAGRRSGPGGSGGVVRRPPPAGVRAARGPAVRTAATPGPRLTGLGGGLFCGAVMFLLGLADQALFGASLTVYGVLFLPVCVLTALWVRAGDVLTAPVVVPIAFAVGLPTVADSGGGTAGRLMGLVTALATQAGWLYGGTLIAGVIALVRRVRVVRQRRWAGAHGGG